MKVLVIQIKMIGDVLASTVICETIKRNHPEAEVHYLIQKNTFAVVDNNPFVDKVLFFEPEEHKGFKNLNAFGKNLKKDRYDIVIDAYCKWDSILPAFFSGAKTRVGHYKWYTTFFYTKTVVPDADCNATANAYRLLLSKTALGKEVEIIYPKIHLRQEEIDKAKTSIKENCDISKPIFMIGILGSGKNKSLPPKYMAETLDIIANEKDVQLLFNYMPKQFDEVKTIYDLCLPTTQAKINLDFYAKSLRDFIGLQSQCDTLIGNEGGATNMAKALEIPTFTIYAPWINRTSWNIKEETGLYDIVHLSDYFPELYQKHAKNYKAQAFEWYEKLKPALFAEKLKAFIHRIRK
jgi:heptosyltransferase-2